MRKYTKARASSSAQAALLVLLAGSILIGMACTCPLPLVVQTVVVTATANPPILGPGATASPPMGAPEATSSSVPGADTTATGEIPTPTSPSLPLPTIRATRAPTATPTPTVSPTPDYQGPDIIILEVDPNPVKVGKRTLVTVKVIDPCGVELVTIQHHYEGESGWHQAAMLQIDEHVYARSIPWGASGFPEVGRVDYYISAYDQCSNTSQTPVLSINVINQE